MADFQTLGIGRVGISILGLVFILLQGQGVRGQNSGGRKCQEITIPMCKDMAYNYTHYPNRFNHDTQDEAGLEVHQFWPLVEINCSPDLRFFLCSLYAPICLPTYSKPLPACRSVCERAKAGCAPLMRMYGFAWPERMRCEDLPEYGDPDHLCMDHNATDTRPSSPSPLPPPSGQGQGRGRSGPATRYNTQQAEGSRAKQQAVSNIDQRGQSSDNCQCKKCPLPWLEVAANVTLTGLQRSPTRTTCMLSCDAYPHFSANQKQFSLYWIVTWSLLCWVSSVSTLLTFLIDTSRFKYPERSIVYMCVCYVFVSIGYMLPLVIDRQSIACNNLNLEGSGGEGGSQWVLRVHTRGPSTCTLTFVLVYSFGMAASLWWVVLSLTWFLAAGLKWSHEAIARYSHYYHLVAWLLPCIASVIVIATSQVDGDPVSGICFVGVNNVTNLRGFILAPLGSCLALGVVFLAAGFVSLFRIRKVIRQQQEDGVKTERFEKLMVRIGVFSLLYTIPATVLLACYLYEDRISDTWLQHQPPAQPCTCKGGGMQPKLEPEPEHAVFMLKYLMSLIVGVTSGIWVWTGKTVVTWRKFCGRLCCCKDGDGVTRGDYGRHHHDDDEQNQWERHRHGSKYGVPLPPLPPLISPSTGFLPPLPIVGGVTVPHVGGGLKLSQSYSNYNCYTNFPTDSVSLLTQTLPHDSKHLPVNHI